MSDIYKTLSFGFWFIFIIIMVIVILFSFPLKGFNTYNINDLDYIISDSFQFVSGSRLITFKKSEVIISKKDFSYVSIGKTIFNYPSGYSLYLTYDDYKKFFGVDYET